MNSKITKKIGNESGAVAIYVAILLPVLLMVAAFGIDINHVFGVRNELQNAADAAALAGAMELNDINGVLTVEDAKLEGERVAKLHSAGGQAVSEMVIQTGHWSNTTGIFTPSENDTQLENWQDIPGDLLDLDTNFINAVRAQTTRSDSPAFFAKIFGIDSLAVTNDAVAWVGFNELTVNYPYAICADTIGWDDNNDDVPDPECNVGSASNDRNNKDDDYDPTSETSMWTNLVQDEMCSEISTNANEMKELTATCGDGAWSLNKLEPTGATNGEVVPAFNNMYQCWENFRDNNGDIPWQLVLPVVDCDDSNTCPKLLGAIQVSIVWMIDQEGPNMDYVPTEMEHPSDPDAGTQAWTWRCDPLSEGQSPETCWAEFVDKFGLKDVSGDPAAYMKRSVYFMTTCMEAEPEGNSSFNPASKILAKYPKLVE
ncbi:pilus assembly protein TadG-related protein [Desulfosediminicola ganghwensis]|uniref:pilus assembly protein TadG-related protein n=1 Tax=Desulfosediminicola ganghwensis TaxID=2569540 RepID=UPI0010ABC561|nr:pilus assembly protein TadG-related protein [Desulfosediminicola ganghwensis]